MKNEKNKTCKGYYDEQGDYACEYDTDITCEECIYGMGNIDPENSNNMFNNIFSPDKEKMLDLLLKTDLNEKELNEVLLYIRNIIFMWYRDERFLNILNNKT